MHHRPLKPLPKAFPAEVCLRLFSSSHVNHPPELASWDARTSKHRLTFKQAAQRITSRSPGCNAGYCHCEAQPGKGQKAAVAKAIPKSAAGMAQAAQNQSTPCRHSRRMAVNVWLGQNSTSTNRLHLGTQPACLPIKLPRRYCDTDTVPSTSEVTLQLNTFLGKHLLWRLTQLLLEDWAQISTWSWRCFHHSSWPVRGALQKL